MCALPNSRTSSAIAFFIAIAGLFLPGCTTTESDAVKVLLPRISGQLTFNSAKSITLKTLGGTVLSIQAHQTDVDLAIVVKSADGLVLLSADAPTRRFGSEYVIYRVPTSGILSIEVSARDLANVSGTYELSVVQHETSFLTSATGQVEAVLSSFATTQPDSSPSNASAILTHGLELLKDPDRLEIDSTFLALLQLRAGAFAYRTAGNWALAIKLANSAMHGYRELGDEVGEMNAQLLHAEALIELAVTSLVITTHHPKLFQVETGRVVAL